MIETDRRGQSEVSLSIKKLLFLVCHQEDPGCDRFIFIHSSNTCQVRASLGRGVQRGAMCEAAVSPTVGATPKILSSTPDFEISQHC